MKILNLILAPLFLLSCFLSFVHGQQEDFFKKYAGPIPGKVHYMSGVNPKEITLRGSGSFQGNYLHGPQNGRKVSWYGARVKGTR